MAFELELIRELQQEVDADRAWFELEGRRFGRESDYVLKIAVGTGGEQWNAGFNEGCQEYANGLSPAGRREFAINCQNPATMDRPSLIIATRKAIQTSKVLTSVAWSGPKFETGEKLEQWLAGDAPYIVRGRDMDVPTSVDPRSLFEMAPDGSYSVDVQTDPPPEWEAPPGAVKHLLTDADFVLQVGTCRRRLEEEGVSGTSEEDVENLEPGPATSSPGKPSPQVSGPDSKSSPSEALI